MCLGLPMRIVETDGVTALVEGRGERREVTLMLVGPQPVGTEVLVLAHQAMRLLAPGEVTLLDDALDAVEKVLSGESVESHFPDLTGRIPELPEHLRSGGDE